MSRVGKQPIKIPVDVKVEIKENLIAICGAKGTLQMCLPKLTTISEEGPILRVLRKNETKEAKSMHGLTRALISNMIEGVTKGFEKRLEIQGVGFKAIVQGSIVNLSLGFSHPINYTLPTGVRVTVEEGTRLIVSGVCKIAVGRVAAELRSYYPPEPYKGKGVRYAGEKIVRKEGKTVQ